MARRPVALVFLSIVAASGSSLAAETLARSGPDRASETAVSAAAPSLQWQAKLAELDPAAGVLVLSGDVTLQLPRLSLQAQRVEARYEAGTRLRLLTGGETKLQLVDTQATAASFELDVSKHSLKLAGPVRIALGAGWTNADRAEVDTQSGRITLHRVKGSLALSIEAPAAVAAP